MCVKEKKCSAWISLESVGIQAQGCLVEHIWLKSLNISSSQDILEQTKYIDLPNEKLTCIKNVAHGKFGYIDLAKYEYNGATQEVYVKRPILSGKSLLYEACIQKLVGDNLSKSGFPTAAPKILKIFRLRDNSICFAMEQINDAMTLNYYLDNIHTSQISQLIIDCILQLSAIVWKLDNSLGINHRDLKPSNFLVVEHNEPTRKILVIDNEILEINSKYSLTLIDFGFSCLGSMTTHKSSISLSTVYSKSDPCPKEGRDLYLFLALLYTDYHHKLPIKLRELFESWLEIEGSNMCNFMRRDKENAKEWIYWMTGLDRIKSLHTCPLKIVKDIQSFI